MTANHPQLKIIYHHPRPITSNGMTGSQVRPYRMLKAFRELGVDVVEVTGDASTRSHIMRQTRERISNGEKFDFVYSENLTIPLAMSEAHRLPLHPLLDHGFLAFCSAQGIPVSMYYRDAFWRVKSYRKMLPWLGRMLTIPLYWYDWWRHSHHLNTLYLPSEATGKVLPCMGKFPSVKYLPPGTEIRETDTSYDQSGSLRLLYVGGIEPPTYDLRPLLEAIQKTDACVTLTLCCRIKEWNRVRELYRPFLNNRIVVVHRSGKELESLYGGSDLCAIALSQGSYFDLALPIKIFESIGFGLPILCTPGGEPARIVESEGLGWVKKPDEIAVFLEELAKHPEQLQKQRDKLKKLRHKHTWKSRAEQVCNEMSAHQRI
ncbi:MAG: glycosyltransferase [Marinobacter sp.]|uniref:glycosyltransferase n=1 Tax=Marinobacter sp. TaxID=50741 RepID=UPI0032975BDE